MTGVLAFMWIRQHAWWFVPAATIFLVVFMWSGSIVIGLVPGVLAAILALTLKTSMTQMAETAARRSESLPVSPLRCSECGRTQGDDRINWRALHGREDDGSVTVVLFCPECAEREFGPTSV